MSIEIENYKKTKIKILTDKYNRDYNSLYLSYRSKITSISRMVISFANKSRMYTSLNNELNSKINILKKTLLADVEKIKNIIIPKFNILRKKAILIGINYIGTQIELSGCINDVNNIEATLTTLGFNDIIKLTDETEIKPTSENIMNEIITSLNSAIPGDLIFISYSGHGSNIKDKNSDETDGFDELIVPLDLKYITDDTLKTIIQNNLKKDVSVVALFDSCNSGTVLDLKFQYLENTKYDTITENDKNLETDGNIIMISGCRDNQLSYETDISNKPEGAMSWSFNTVINKNHNITWRQLLKNMRSVLSGSKFTQIPQMSSGKLFNMDSNIIL